jgi:hypothetical protein
LLVFLQGHQLLFRHLLQKATIDGVVLLPSALGITTGSLPSITETQELVVPKSIPIILLMQKKRKKPIN